MTTCKNVNIYKGMYVLYVCIVLDCLDNSPVRCAWEEPFNWRCK